MSLRLILIFALFAPPAFAQKRALFESPPKPRVISTPTPTPAPKPARKSREATKPKPETAPEPAAEPAQKPAAEPAPEAAVERKRPGGDYVSSVKAAFAARWAEAASPRMKDFAAGAVSLTFKLDAEGKVLDVEVTDNTSNEAFGKFCAQFVRETIFGKPPAKSLTEGQIEIPFTFKIY